MEFAPSNPDNIGLEIEFQILDSESFDLTDGIVPIQKALDDPEHFKSEFCQSTVEIASNVCRSIAELEDDVRGLFGRLVDTAQQLGFRLCAAGTHPFFEGAADVTPDPRYSRMEQQYGYVAQIDITFATHVHIGVQSRRRLLALHRDFRAFLPVFVALSANSPFWRGHQTGYRAFRHIALAMGRSYGLPPTFDTWEAWADFMGRARRAGMVDSVRDFHWEVRPRADLGTVELRTMDAFSTISESVAFAAFVQALADYCRQTPPEARPDALPCPTSWWFGRENFFQAARAGLEATYVYDDGEPVALRDVIRKTLQVARPCAEQRGTEANFDVIEALVERPGYRRQLDRFEEAGSIPAVTEHLVEILDD